MPPSKSPAAAELHPHDLFRPFFVAVGALTLLFLVPLARLITFALGSALYSHIVLVPCVSVFLVWIRRGSIVPPLRHCGTGAAVCAAAATASVFYALLGNSSPELDPNHALTWFSLGYVLSITSAVFWYLGSDFVRSHIVALVFLLFMVPMPGWLEYGSEMALQRGSAVAADLFFSWSNIPFFRDGQVFRLPSITMEIAQECSGIHSSLVLFIVSIVAGQMFLPPGWRRWVLTLAAFPLALVRNGFRVFTLGFLCEKIGPHMIDHWIHHRGGPIFFVLSLIPFFALLLALARIGRHAPAKDNQARQLDASQSANEGNGGEHRAKAEI